MLLALLLGLGLAAWLALRGHSPADGGERASASNPVITKEPVNAATRTFDPANPPADMPSLPGGENAECESNFGSNAVVSGERRRIDATHASVTVTQVHVTLQLQVTIWVPDGVSQHVMEHEEGHRRISETYYETAEQVAGRVARNYLGREIAVTGDDLDTASNEALRQIGAEITDDYNKQLNPNPAQLLYDSITDHSRNTVDVQEAIDHALKNVAAEVPAPANADPR